MSEWAIPDLTEEEANDLMEALAEMRKHTNERETSMTSKSSAQPLPGDFPKIGESVHYAVTRHQCRAALVTDATPPSAYNAADDEEAYERRQAEDYQPISLVCFSSGTANPSQVQDVPRSPDKMYAGTWHRIDECPRAS